MKKFRFLTLVLIILLTQFLYNNNVSFAEDEESVIDVKNFTYNSQSI